jgi:hypothetical protein
MARELRPENRTPSSTLMSAVGSEHSAQKPCFRKFLIMTTSRCSTVVLVRRVRFISDSRLGGITDGPGQWGAVCLCPSWLADVVLVAPIPAFAYNGPGNGTLDLGLQISISNERKNNARSFQNLSERPKENGNFPEIAPEATNASSNQTHL